MTTDWNTFSALVLFAISVVGFFWKVTDRREKKRQELAEKRNHELMETIKKVNKPNVDRLEDLERDNIDLKAIADRSLKLHEQHEKNFNNLDRRVLVLEKTTSGARTIVGYKEIHESEER